MLTTILNDKKIYIILEDISHKSETDKKEILDTQKLNYKINKVGSTFTFFLPMRRYDYFDGTLERGTYSPSQFEAAFIISTAHNSEDINRTLRAF